MAKIVEIRGQVQNYDWGKLGAASSVARLWSAATEPCGAIDEARPYAELWLGTHLSGPARLAATDGGAPGPLLRDHLGADLPFLLKNLSVNKALSIQAHPNKSLAARLHASAPQHYKDANHKPEMAIAIGDFQCMCGFRPVADIGACLRGVPELRAMVGAEVVERFEGAAAAGDEAAIKWALRAVFEAVMKCSDVNRFLEPLLARIRVTPLSTDLLPSVDASAATAIDLTELLLRLSTQYPGDIGIFAPFLLNTFTLRAGEAVFLGPNLPHAYLDGDCIEAMACSDNVVRAGLTPKLRDVDVLCAMLTYETGAPRVLRGGVPIAGGDACSSVYAVPAESDVDEFEVTRTQVGGGAAGAPQQCDLPAVRGAAILLVVAGAGTVTQSSTEQPHSLALRVGTSVLVPDSVGVRFSATGAAPLVVYRCSARQSAVPAHQAAASHL